MKYLCLARKSLGFVIAALFFFSFYRTCKCLFLYELCDVIAAVLTVWRSNGRIVPWSLLGLLYPAICSTVGSRWPWLHMLCVCACVRVGSGNMFKNKNMHASSSMTRLSWSFHLLPHWYAAYLELLVVNCFLFVWYWCVCAYIAHSLLQIW